MLLILREYKGLAREFLSFFPPLAAHGWLLKQEQIQVALKRCHRASLQPLWDPVSGVCFFNGVKLHCQSLLLHGQC